MKIKIFLIFFLILFSNVESKEIKVSKINLLDNIEKHILLKEVSNYLFESKYSGKNKKYSTFNIKNSTIFFKNIQKIIFSKPCAIILHQLLLLFFHLVILLLVY